MMPGRGFVAAVLALLVVPTGVHAAAIDGATLSLWWGAPFAGLLLSLAILPAAAPKFWHNRFPTISAAWAIAFLAPFMTVYGLGATGEQLAHAILEEYLPFILLVGSLFIVTGGLHVAARLSGSPASNTLLLGIGTAIASLIGTTGAAMLLLAPLLRANRWRERTAHIFIFHIFLTANIGGALTPIGDPPLFLGYLSGIDFFWTTKAMFLPMLTLVGPLLIGFFLLDRHHWRRETRTPAASAPDAPPGFKLSGAVNLLFLAVIVGAVLLSGMWRSPIALNLFGTEMPLQNLVRGSLLILAALGSWFLTPARLRRENGFDWFPITEVAVLFLAIFITILPVIAILKAGAAGPAAILINIVGGGAEANPLAYFWVTGILSSLLDNAPTYLVFFNAAGGDPAWLMGEGARILLGISMGAVFMGANSYIGNAPNLMVRAMVVRSGVTMPGFIGYIGWALVWLLPLFVIQSWLFFR